MHEPSDRTVILINPVAGGGRAGRLWQRLRRAAPELADACWIQADDADTARAELVTHLQNGCRRVVAVGGDGTAHLVVGTLLATGRGSRVAFGLVPAGTGSDLARGLGLPRRPTAALRHALAVTARPIDAVAIENSGGGMHYAVNIVSAGLSGAIAPKVNAKARRGQWSYLRTTVAALVRYRPVSCRVEVDGEPFYDGEFFLAAFANGRYFGNGMPVAPDARVDDGRLDVVLVPPVPRWHLPYRLPQFLTGRHVRLPFVKTRRAERVRLEPAEGFPAFEADGECLPPGPVEIRVLPKALQVLAP